MGNDELKDITDEVKKVYEKTYFNTADWKAAAGSTPSGGLTLDMMKKATDYIAGKTNTATTPSSPQYKTKKSPTPNSMEELYAGVDFAVKKDKQEKGGGSPSDLDWEGYKAQIAGDLKKFNMLQQAMNQAQSQQNALLQNLNSAHNANHANYFNPQYTWKGQNVTLEEYKKLQDETEANLKATLPSIPDDDFPF